MCDVYVSQVDEFAVDVLVANSTDSIISLLFVVELAERPVEDKRVEQTGNSLLHLPALEGLDRNRQIRNSASRRDRRKQDEHYHFKNLSPGIHCSHAQFAKTFTR